MSRDFEELDYQQTPMGELILRRRRDLSLDTEIYEVKLGEAFLMSSLFHEAEVALANLGLAALADGEQDVVVEGSGLGYTAAAALGHSSVRSMLVIEALAPVVQWHRRSLVPLGSRLAGDPRCRLAHGDFFALADSEEGFDPDFPGRRFHAVLLDIDHSPRSLLHQRHASFYHASGLRALTRHLLPGGVFAMWSDDPPDGEFIALLETVFTRANAHVVAFANPLLGRLSKSTVYVAVAA